MNREYDDDRLEATLRAHLAAELEGQLGRAARAFRDEVRLPADTARRTRTLRSHAWIIGFAGPPGQPASVAVAVLVEGQPGASEQTGGQVAAPIARAVMETVLAAQRGGA